LLRQGPNKVVFNSAKAIHGERQPGILACTYSDWTDIYQCDRILKSSAYVAARTIPKGYNTWNLTDKDHHRVRRRILGQGLSERAIRQFEPIMLQKIDVFLGNLLKAFRKDEAIETTQACTFLGFDIIFELAYGYNAKLQTSEKVRWLVNGILMANRRINVFLQWPFLKKTKVDKLFTLLLTPQVLRYHKQVFTMIEQRKNQEKHARPDLFSFVSGYKDPETGQGLSNDELFAESILLLPAGGDVRKPRVHSAL
jgi:cytochrome P450